MSEVLPRSSTECISLTLNVVIKSGVHLKLFSIIF